MSVALLSQGIARCGRTVEQVNVVRLVVNAFSQDIDDAAAADLVLQPVEELAPCVAVLVQGKGCGDVGCVASRKVENCFRSTQ